LARRICPGRGRKTTPQGELPGPPSGAGRPPIHGLRKAPPLFKPRRGGGVPCGGWPKIGIIPRETRGTKCPPRSIGDFPVPGQNRGFSQNLGGRFPWTIPRFSLLGRGIPVPAGFFQGAGKGAQNIGGNPFPAGTLRPNPGSGNQSGTTALQPSSPSLKTQGAPNFPYPARGAGPRAPHPVNRGAQRGESTISSEKPSADRG